MGFAAYLYLLCTHPNEFRSLVQYKIWHEAKRDITSQREHETSGWDRESMRRCWEFLDMTSRSFAAVIKELEGDMARMVCVPFLPLFFALIFDWLGNRCVCSTSSSVDWTRSRMT
jgi:farnesyl-diphosphate farnesyltransferase